LEEDRQCRSCAMKNDAADWSVILQANLSHYSRLLSYLQERFSADIENIDSEDTGNNETFLFIKLKSSIMHFLDTLVNSCAYRHISRVLVYDRILSSLEEVISTLTEKSENKVCFSRFTDSLASE
jgi:hypothetical protein